MDKPELQACSLPEIAEKYPEEADRIAKQYGITPWMDSEYPEQVAELREKGMRKTKNQAYAFRGIDRTLVP